MKLVAWLALVTLAALAGCGGRGSTSTSSAGTAGSGADAGPIADGGAGANAGEPAPDLDLATVARLVIEAADAPVGEKRSAILAWVEVLARAGAREQALAVLDELARAADLSDNDLVALAERYAELGMVERVAELSSMVKDVYRHDTAFRHGVGYHAKRDDCAFAERLLEAGPGIMERPTEDFLGGLSLDSMESTYEQQVLAECLARTGEHDRALEIARACCRCQNFNYKGGNLWCGGCEVSGVLGILVRAEVASGDLDRAVGLVDANTEYLHEQAYSKVHDMNAEESIKHKGGRSYWSAAAMKKMIERSTAAAVADLLGEIVVAGLERGLRDEALGVIDKVEGAQHKDGVKARAVRALTEGGDVDRALEIARSIEGRAARADALVTAARALTDPGREEQPIQVLREAYALARRVRVEEWQRPPAVAVRQELARAGDVETAWKAFRTARKGDRCQGTRELLVALGEAGMFERAGKVIAACSSSGDDLAAYGAACVRGGGHERAVSEINERNAGKDKDVPFGVVESVARACVETETCRPVLEVLDRIASDQRREYARLSAGEQLVDDGRVDQALAIVDSLGTYRQRDLVEHLIASLIRGGEIERAVEIASSLTDAAGNAAAAAVADGFADAGDEQRAREWADRSGSSDEYRFWLRLAEGLLAAGEPDRADECLASIQQRQAGEQERAPGVGNIDEALVRAAERNAEEGRFERALFLLSYVENDGTRVHRIHQLARVVVERDAPPTAIEPALLRPVVERLSR